MVVRLTDVVVDWRDPIARVQLWTSALGYHVVASDDGQVGIAPR